MSFVQTGDLVRIYYEDDFFDEGTVSAVVDDLITVDFYDWIEQWPDSAFRIRDLFYEGIEVLVPTQRGTIVIDFRGCGGSSP